MQKVLIKNLGPIKNAEIYIKPFVVFVGRSGSGKSVVMRAVSMLKWVYKKMQYKAFLKNSKIKNNAIRFNLTRLKKDSMLDDFIKPDTYIEFFDNNTSIIKIENLKIKPNYKSITSKNFINSKIVFLNDSRVALPEILSSAGGRKAKFSYYTSDIIDNFYQATNYLDSNEFKISTLNIDLITRKKDGYKQFFIKKDNDIVKFDSSSSGEKNVSIIELIANFYAKNYDFSESFTKNLIELITNNIDIENIENIKNYMKKSSFSNSLDIFIEEPEANLFPIDQKNMAYFLSSFGECRNKPNVIFSTHSPYILTALNNLIYAKNIIKEKPELKNKICNIIDENSLLDFDNLSVYYLDNGDICDILDYKTNLINAEQIDKASNIILDDFDKIFNIQKANKYE